MSADYASIPNANPTNNPEESKKDPLGKENNSKKMLTFALI